MRTAGLSETLERVLAQGARSRLTTYDWPGNMREREHLMLRASLRAAEGRRHQDVVVEVAHLELDTAPVSRSPEPTARRVIQPEEPVVLPGTIAEAVDAFRRKMIEAALSQAHGNGAEAARRLGSTAATSTGWHVACGS